MFKGTTPPSQFPANVASGAPPMPSHSCFEEGVHVWFESLWRRGGGKGLQHAHYIFQKKKFSPRTTCARTMPAHRLHIVCTNVPHGVLLLSQNMDDWSGGVEEGNERGAKSACPPDDQSSPHRHWTNRLPDGFSPFWHREVHPSRHHHAIACRPRLQRQADCALILCSTKTTNIGA